MLSFVAWRRDVAFRLRCFDRIRRLYVLAVPVQRLGLQVRSILSLLHSLKIFLQLFFVQFHFFLHLLLSDSHIILFSFKHLNLFVVLVDLLHNLLFFVFLYLIDSLYILDPVNTFDSLIISRWRVRFRPSSLESLLAFLIVLSQPCWFSPLSIK